MAQTAQGENVNSYMDCVIVGLHLLDHIYSALLYALRILRLSLVLLAYESFVNDKMVQRQFKICNGSALCRRDIWDEG